MNPCEPFQERLLEHLYDLLDSEEIQELGEHLRLCEKCREALARAETEKQRLGVAAKLAFPDEQFIIPADEVDAAEAPVVLPMPSSSGWVRWCVAAGIVFLILGLGIPGGLYSRQQDRVATAETRLQAIDKTLGSLKGKHAGDVQQANKEIADIQAEIATLAAAQRNEVAQAETKVRNQDLHLTIVGPKTPEPGALNKYDISIRNRERGKAPGRVTVRLLDARNQPIEVVTNAPCDGDLSVLLPRDLHLAPNANLDLEVTVQANDGPLGRLTEKLNLGAAVYLTHLATDKPMYQPGEIVRFRSLTLERFGLKPVREDLHLVYTITKPNSEKTQILDGLDQVVSGPGKDPLLGPDNQPIQGIGTGEYPIDPEAPGGEYTLTVSEARQRFLPQERKFIVNKYEKPRLNKELEFTSKTYGPGESVTASCKVARVEGGKPVANVQVDAKIDIDGKTYGADGKEGQTLSLRTDDQGKLNVKFKLPEKIAKGVASLSVTFHDADVETIVRSIPIVLKTLQVEFFPEGGDLIAGVPNRVYFQARTTLGKPAELKGRIVDEQGQVMTDVRSFNDPDHPGANQGQGTFWFTPLSDKKYQLKIDSPAGIEGECILPAAKRDGVVLNVESGVTTDTEDINIEVRSAKTDRSLLVGAYCRGRLMAHQRLAVKHGESAKLALKPEHGAGGVFRVTVFEEIGLDGNRLQLAPRAERLVYREPSNRLRLTVQTDKKRYFPGDRVKLQCQARDENDQAQPAILMVAVVDKSVLKLADEKTYKSMPTHFLLASEIRRPEDLEHADFLLGSERSARTALDLLLGVQGWRRFAEQEPGKFRQEHRDRDAERLLVLQGQLTPDRLAPALVAFDEQPVRQVVAKYATRFSPLVKTQTRLGERREAVLNDESVLSEMAQLQEERNRTEQDYRSAVSELNGFKNWFLEWRLWAAPVLVVVLFLAIFTAVVLGLSRSHSQRAVLYTLTAGCSIVLLGIVSILQLGTTVSKTFSAVNSAMAPGGGGRGDQFAAAEPAPKPAPERLEKNNKAPGALPPAPVNAPAAEEARNFNVNKDQDKAGLGGKGEGKDWNRAKRLADRKHGAIAAGDRLAAAGPFRARALKNQNGDGKGFGGKMAEQAGFAKADEMRFDGAMANGMLRDMNRDALKQAMLAGPAPCIVREYAHQRVSSPGAVRVDFTETICWQPVLVLPDGRAETSFDLGDSVTTFQVLASGHTLDGRLGAMTTELEARLPITLEPKMPIEVTASDKIDIPLTIANNTDEAIALDVHVRPTSLALLQGKGNDRVQLAADQRRRRLYRVRPTILEGEAKLRFDGKSPTAPGDSIERTFKVVPDGFPFVGAQSDLLEKVARYELVLPETWVKGTLQARVTVYPSTLADLQKGLDALLREPNGCFEQTSTSNYPNLLVLDYLKNTDQAKPEVARRARDLLDRGYQKLVSFECLAPGNQREGYEWFGGTAPAHEALTAYGLMQFRDMARVYDVDKAMVERTSHYLMSRKDGKGGFKRNARALDTFGRAPDDITNAYIVWALTEGGKEDDIARELAALLEQAKASRDPYFLALVANSLCNRDQKNEASELLKKLAELQDKDGHLDATRMSITGSGGRDLQIETTALSLLAWLKVNRADLFNTNVQNAVKWLGKQRGGYGGFGSTQATILALKALIAFAHANKKTSEAGDLVLFVGDKEIQRLPFAAGADEALVLDLPDAKDILLPGKNQVRVEMSGKSVFPYTLTWAYRTLTPASAEACPIRLATSLSRTKVDEGETVRLSATVENKSGKDQGMTLAIIGLPAGLTLPEDMKQLKDLAHVLNDGALPGKISYWEVRGRELILYWRGLARDQKIEVNLDLICRVPGEYRGPASRAYLYYNADHKHWVEPLQVHITPKSAD